MPLATDIPRVDLTGWFRASTAARVIAPLAVAVTAAGCSMGAGAAPQPPADPAPPVTLGPATGATLHTVLTAAQQTMPLSASINFSLEGGSGSSVSRSRRPISGRGLIDFATGTGSARIFQPNGQEYFIFEPTTVYDQPVSGTTAVILPQGKSWIAAEPSEKAGLRFSMIALQFEEANPAYLLDQVAWGATSARPSGQQTIGTSTETQYDVTVDLDLAAAHASGPTATAFAAALADQKELAPKSASAQTVQVTIDSSGRVVQLRAALSASGYSQTTISVADFGIPVQQAKPPADQTVDLAAFGGDTDHD